MSSSSSTKINTSMKVEKTPRGPKNQGLLDPRDQMAELKKVIEFSGEEQVQMMMNLLNFYESENMKLKEEAQIKETSNKNLVRRINEKETERRNLTKRVSKLEDFLKLERRANEGMRKKVQHFESENYQVEDQRNEMRDSQARLREKLAEYEVTFNRDRSKLLKTMHENDVLQSRNQDLDDRACQAEAELVGSREKAFNYLRQIETLNGKLDYQNNLINAQAREMAAIQGELNDLKIRHSRLSEENVQHLHEIGRVTMATGVLESEASYLRSEIVKQSYNSKKGGRSDENRLTTMAAAFPQMRGRMPSKALSNTFNFTSPYGTGKEVTIQPENSLYGTNASSASQTMSDGVKGTRSLLVDALEDSQNVPAEKSTMKHTYSHSTSQRAQGGRASRRSAKQSQSLEGSDSVFQYRSRSASEAFSHPSTTSASAKPDLKISPEASPGRRDRNAFVKTTSTSMPVAAHKKSHTWSSSSPLEVLQTAKGRGTLPKLHSASSAPGEASAIDEGLTAEEAVHAAAADEEYSQTSLQKELKQKTKIRADPRSHLTIHKSIFLGQGLGLRQAGFEQLNDGKGKGTAKQLLAKIMDDFHAKEERAWLEKVNSQKSLLEDGEVDDDT